MKDAYILFIKLWLIVLTLYLTGCGLDETKIQRYELALN